MSKSNLINRELWKSVYKMYMVDKIPIEEIAEKLGYQPESISKLREQFGLPPRTKEWLYNEYAASMFNEEQEQIILGGMLGDGCILSRTSRNPIYTETHSIHQLEYISWKQTKLYPFVKSVSIGHKETQAQIRSVAMPQLRFYRNVFYPDDHKLIPVESLKWLDDLALAVWYMDDGSITQKSSVMRFATCGFNLKTVGMLQGWMATKYDIMSYIYVDKGIYPNLVIQKESNNKLMKIIEPHIIPSMRYKLGQL